MMNGFRQALSYSSRILGRSVVAPKSSHNTTVAASLVQRSFSTLDYDTSAFDNFIPTPPVKLTVEMAEGITDATQFYVKHGVSSQRLKALTQEKDMPAVIKWQKMMEIFLTTQVHVIAGLGYAADEQGLTKYAQDLSQCMMEADDDIRDLFTEMRRDTWRDLVSSAFDLDQKQLKTLSIVDARNVMHKVASKMVEPDVLLEIQSRCAKLPERDDPQLAMAEKHQVLQHVIVHTVYLSGNPSLVEEAGFGSGEKGYASLQCAMSDHEGDPLINQYAAASMEKIWQAAGLPMSALQGGLTGGSP